MLKEALGPWQAVGSVIALAGMVVIIARGELGRASPARPRRWRPVVLGAVLCFTGYSVLLRRAEFELARLPLLVLLLGAGVAAAAPFFAWEWLTGQRATMNASGLLALAYVAIPSEGGDVLIFYNYSVDVLGASKAGVFSSRVVFSPCSRGSSLGNTSIHITMKVEQ